MIAIAERPWWYTLQECCTEEQLFDGLLCWCRGIPIHWRVGVPYGWVSGNDCISMHWFHQQRQLKLHPIVDVRVVISIESHFQRGHLSRRLYPQSSLVRRCCHRT